jgi:putative membrane protein
MQQRRAARSKHFQAATGGMAEVEMGKLAADKGLSSDVKKFAEQMVSDHTKANEELEKLASGKSLKVPHSLDADHKAKLAMLSKQSGVAFDEAYVKAQIVGHEKMQQLLDHEAKASKDSELKAFAQKTPSDRRAPPSDGERAADQGPEVVHLSSFEAGGRALA